MLYQKPIDEITWDDVESFCQQSIAEGATLDYKQDFPSALENTIAAMANTLGGLLLIGVAEDSQGKPQTPIKGISPDRGLADRVMNIILTNITPPVFPEIQVCVDTTGEKAAIVIRVHESDETPHAIAQNTKVYLRTGARNKPEELATVDQIEWLRNRREKSTAFRTALYKRANDHFLTLGYGGRPTSTAVLSLSMCPLFPKIAFRTPPEMNDVYHKVRVRDYYGTSSYFPLPDHQGRLLHDGIAITLKEMAGYYTELNGYGLYFYAQRITRSIKQGAAKGIECVRASEIFCRVDEFVDSAEQYFDQLGYRGIIHFVVRLTIHGPDKCPLLHWSPSGWDEGMTESPDNEIQYEVSVSADALFGDKSRWILEPVQRLCWGFDYNVTAADLQQYFHKSKPRGSS